MQVKGVCKHSKRAIDQASSNLIVCINLFVGEDALTHHDHAGLARNPNVNFNPLKSKFWGFKPHLSTVSNCS